MRGRPGIYLRQKTPKTSWALAPEATLHYSDDYRYADLIRDSQNTHASKQKKSEARAPLSFSSSPNLAPVSFHHLPVVAAVSPAVSNPALTRMRWTIPAAADPHIMSAIPTVIAVDPNIAAIRRRRATLHDRWRGRHANNNLRIRGRRQKGKSEQCCHCNFLHHQLSPPGYGFPEKSSCVPAC